MSVNPSPKKIGVWFPAVRAGTGVDVFTVRLKEALKRRGIRSDISWLPLRAEYLPWSVLVPEPPEWANIVHVNSWIHPRFIPKNLKLVTTIHGCVHDLKIFPYKSFLQRLYHRFWIKYCESACIGKSDAVTAVSKYTAEISGSIFQRSPIDTIYNWIDSDRFTPLRKRDPHEPFRLLFVGKPSKRKGKELLPKIMEKLGPDFELYFTGEHKDLMGVENDIPDNIFFMGQIQQENVLIQTYRESDAFLFPTRLEGFGLVALEAQACGVPVVSTNCSSLPEVVDHGKSGILCPVDDVDAFVSAVKTLRNDQECWRMMCRQARKHAVTKFDMNLCVNQYISIYAKLTGK